MDSRRSIGARLPVDAEIVLACSRMVTEARSGGYRPPRSGMAADLAGLYLLLAVAVLGAKAQLLGKAVMDDAALRGQSVNVAFEESRTFALTKRPLPLGE